MMKDLDPRDAQAVDSDRYLPVYKRHPLTLTKGKGARVVDVEGHEYIDALAGVAVNSTGHSHPTVVKAVQEQAERLIHVSNFYVTGPQAALSKELTDRSGLGKAFFSNSGAEAVEAAIKGARLYGNRNGKGGRIITMEGCFHGRSLATIAAGKEAYQEGFGPIPEGFSQVPFNDLDAVKKELDADTCAILVEPIQGEGGIRVADPAFLKGLRELCDEKDLLLIFDEVQCGMGRTGSFFAYEDYGVEPDILCLAKALGGGVPIGATLFSERVAEEFAPGQHGSTFGGNPLACAAALAVIRAIDEEGLCERANRLGEKAFGRLKQIQARFPAVKDVRGKGLMIGVELESGAQEVLNEMLEGRVLGNVTAGEVLRLVPPLVIEDKELEQVLDVMEGAIEKVHL